MAIIQTDYGMIKPPPGCQLDWGHPMMMDIVGYWMFNEKSGIRLTDYSGQCNHGTLTNFAMTGASSNWVGSPTGGALNFDGSNDYINCGNNNNFSYAEFTAVTWVRFSALSNAYTTILVKQKISPVSYLSFNVKSTGKLALYLRKDGGSVISYDGTGAFTLVVNTWYQITMMYSTSFGLRGYVNGLLDGSAAANGDAGGLNGTGATEILSFGGDLVNAGRYLNGYIDRILFYKKPKTQQFIQQLYSQPNIGIQSPTYYTPS